MDLTGKVRQSNRTLDRLEVRGSRQVVGLYRDTLNEVRREVGLLFERYAGPDGRLRMADVQKYNRLGRTEEAIATAVSDLRLRQVRMTKGLLIDLYKTTFYWTAFSVETALGADIGFTTLPTRAYEKAWENPLDRVGWPDRTREQAAVAVRQLREELATGIQQNKTYNQVTKALKDRLGMAAKRAERIVRTEGHRVRENARWESLDDAEEKGVEFIRRWLATLDEVTRDMHQDMDGREADVERDGEVLFRLPDGVVGYPGNTGVAHHDINCRCDVTAEVKDFRPQTRRARLTDKEHQKRKAEEKRRAEAEDREPRPVPRSEVIANMTYREWQEMKGIQVPA